MEASPLPRCCPQHHDWSILATHLIDAFPRASSLDVAAEVRFAYDAVERLNLHEDAMLIGELIARYRLLVRVGVLPDVARLDPQSHSSRGA
jgi:hypothetical protein